MGLIAWSLLAFGGVYGWSLAPVAVGTAVLVAACPPRVVAHGDLRALDLSLAGLLVGSALQLVPMPAAALEQISPAALRFEALYHLGAPAGGMGRGLHTISIDRGDSVQAAAVLLSVVLLFWVCRRLFEQGGVRTIARGVAWLGLATVLLAIVQRATSPARIYWWWRPLQEGASPLGPVINRNHFATWMLLGVSLSIGYAVTRLEAKSAQHDEFVPARIRLLRAIDHRTLWLGLAVTLMTLGVFVSTSRSGILGLLAAFVCALVLARKRLSRRTRWSLAAFVVILAFAILSWANLDIVARRFDSVLTDETGEVGGRMRIWRETLPVIRDFWLTGSGIGTYGTAMLVYQQTSRQMHFNHAHNHYLQAAAEGGLLLSVSAAIAIAAFVLVARRRLAEDQSPMHWMRVGGVAGLAGVAVQSVWDVGLTMPANAVLCAVTAAIVSHRHRASAPQERS